MEPILLNETIEVDEKTLGQLELYGGEEPADQIFRFAKRNSVEKIVRDQIIDNICEIPHIHCSRRIPSMFHIGLHGSKGTLACSNYWREKRP